jgi:hypothetical protein
MSGSPGCAAPPPAIGVAARTLPWVVLLYAAATLLHFVHNAEFLAAYPNLPSTWSRADVYVAWLALAALGACGYLSYRHGRTRTGLALLGLYACLGFAGFLHYSRAAMSHHSTVMNVTIWTEAVAAALLLINLALLLTRGAHPTRR